MSESKTIEVKRCSNCSCYTSDFEKFPSGCIVCYSKSICINSKSPYCYWHKKEMSESTLNEWFERGKRLDDETGNLVAAILEDWQADHAEQQKEIEIFKNDKVDISQYQHVLFQRDRYKRQVGELKELVKRIANNFDVKMYECENFNPQEVVNYLRGFISRIEKENEEEWK